MGVRQRDPRARAGLSVTRLARLWTNDVETGRSAAYPDVRPLGLPLTPADAYELALAVARAMPRWTTVAEDPVRRRLHAEARTKRVGFVDDVTVWVEDAAPAGAPEARAAAHSRLHARSRSRVGITDFGTNARRLRAYLAAVAAGAPGGA